MAFEITNTNRSSSIIRVNDAGTTTVFLANLSSGANETITAANIRKVAWSTNGSIQIVRNSVPILQLHNTGTIQFDELNHVIANNNTVEVASFVYPVPFKTNNINDGIWQFNFFGYADRSNCCKFTASVFKINSSYQLTLLFSIDSAFISSTDSNNPELLTFETAQQNFLVNQNTDTVAIKIYASTTRTSNTAITLYHSGSRYFSRINSPLFQDHNNLSNLQGGNAIERYHLTNSQVGLVNLVPNKKDKITPIIATTKGSATKTATITVNEQGDVTNISDQDIAIPISQITNFNTSISTATQTALNLKQDKSEKGQPNGYAPQIGRAHV